MENKIKELITATPIKVQVSLDEDSSNEEVMAQLDDTCKGLAKHEETGQRLKWVIAQILIVVKERRLWADGFETFDLWLQARVLDRYKLARSTVLEKLPVLETIPEAPKLKVTFTNLATMTKALRATPEARREKVKGELMSKSKLPVAEFKADVERRFSLRHHRGHRMSSIVLRVTPDLAAAWRKYIGERSGADVLAELIGYHPGRKGHHGTRRRVA